MEEDSFADETPRFRPTRCPQGVKLGPQGANTVSLGQGQKKRRNMELEITFLANDCYREERYILSMVVSSEMQLRMGPKFCFFKFLSVVDSGWGILLMDGFRDCGF